MPRCCNVAGCKSNYRSQQERVSTFAVPKEEPLRSLWFGKIPRDLSQMKNPIVCIKHFDESSIIRTNTCTINGELDEYERKIPKLKEGSFPTIFPNVSEYLSSAPSASRIRTKVDIKKSAQSFNEEKSSTALGSDQNSASLHDKDIEGILNASVKQEPAEDNSEYDIGYAISYGDIDIHETDIKSECMEAGSNDEELCSPTRSSIEHDEKVARFTCDVCFKIFSRAFLLNAHKHIHTGKKSFGCNICMKTFRQRSSLDKHKRTHTGEKPFECNVCMKTFSIVSNLNAHKRIHTGEKPFECNICMKTFRLGGNLNAHKRIHTGEKPFECNICTKTFRQVAYLNAHKRIHTGEKPFECNICMKTFGHKSSVLRHNKRIHSGEKRFE